MSGMRTTQADQRIGEHENRLRVEVREFLHAELAAETFVPACDSWMSGFDPEFSARLGARGLLGVAIPADFGGRGLGAIERVVVAEELLAQGAPVAAHWIADRQMAPSLLANGSEEQKWRYLPGIASGTVFFAIGMSEPEAGSDLAAVRTRATEVAGGWQLDGTKLWTTGAHLAHAMIVLARTDGDPSSRHSGLSQFVVDLPHPDIEIRPIRSIDGAAHFNEVIFHGARVESSALLGARGAGWEQVMKELAWERSGPERYLSTMPLLRAWADVLRREGATEEQRATLGMLMARAWSLRRMSMTVARDLSAGLRPDVTAAMVKDLGSVFEGELVEAVRRSSTVTARIGSSDPFAQLLADAVLHTPAFTLRGGTNEILRSIVSRGWGTP